MAKRENTTIADTATPAPTPIAQVAIDDIEIGTRLRGVDDAAVELIAASMSEIGQETPIIVQEVTGGSYLLVAGAHRLAAARALGWGDIRAKILPVSVSAERRQLIEIDENLARRELSELDRAVFLAERKRLYEVLHPEATWGGVRQVAKLGDLPPGGFANVGEPSEDGSEAPQDAVFVTRFSADTAARIGLSERSIQRSVARALRIAPDVRAQIAHLPLADKGSELDQLAALDKELQRKLAPMLAGGQARNVKQAHALYLGRDLGESDKPTAYESFLKLWRRAPSEDRSQIRTYLAGDASRAMPGGRREGHE